jgi:hypothetical protein
MKSSSVEWTDPKAIQFKISPHDDLAGVQDGDWDLERRFPLETSVKFRSIVQRYAHKRPWEETDLFTDAYRRRFEAGESIRGEPTMEGLLAQYYSRVDGMFKAMKRKGFDAQHPLPKFLIGRGGELFIGNQGNHRLAMAHVLGMKAIAGEIICRHRLA